MLCMVSCSFVHFVKDVLFTMRYVTRVMLGACAVHYCMSRVFGCSCENWVVSSGLHAVLLHRYSLPLHQGCMLCLISESNKKLTIAAKIC